jgi:hypothetical protein
MRLKIRACDLCLLQPLGLAGAIDVIHGRSPHGIGRQWWKRPMHCELM